MDIRMMAFDIDGTLKGKGDYFPEINRRALQECERRGIKLILCSGRSFETLREFAKDLGINALMASCNGARLDASPYGPLLKENVYDDETSMRIYRMLKDSGMYFNAYKRGHGYMANAEMRHELGKYRHHVAYTKESDGYVYEWVDDEERMLSEGTRDTYKYVALGHEYDSRFKELTDAVSDLNMSISSASRYNLEFMMPGVDKGLAVRFFAEREGIPLENIMAFGDNTNDLPMLETVGWPVVMENGEEQVKAKARLIAPHHDEGGVGQIIEKYVLNRG